MIPTLLSVWALAPIWLPSSLSPSIEVAEGTPVRGEATVVSTLLPSTISGSTVRVEAVYGPNAKVAKRVVIGTVSKQTPALNWTPERPGIVTLELHVQGSAPGSKPLAKTTLSVAFNGTPTSGVLMMLAAGLVLFGGAFITLRQIMRA